MTLPVIILRIDTSGTAFGVAPTWTDRTSYLLTAGDGEPIGITWGRQDEQGEPQPATCSFLLDNTTGFWTPGNAAAPANWDVGCPVNVRVTANAVTYDRFTGLVDSIEPTWPGGVQSWSVVKVTATDVSARLGLSQVMSTFVRQEIKAAGASSLYPLSEAEGAVSAGEMLSNGPTATLRNAIRGPGTVAFGTDMGLREGATGAQFTATVPADGEDYATVLNINGAFVPGLSGWTILMTVVMPGSIGATGAGLMAMSNGGAQSVNLRSVPGPPLMQFDVNSTAGGNVRAYGAALTDGGLHQFAMVLGSDRRTSTLYQDAVAGTPVVAGAAHDLTGLNKHIIGGNFSITNDVAMPLQGSIADYAIIPSALSAAEILAIWQMTLGTFTERSDLRFSRIAGFGGITTSGLPTGDATMGAQSTVGLTAIDALKTVARTEGTVTYVTPAGALTFQDRSQRYHEAVGLSLTADDVTQDFMPRRDRQNQFNEITVTREGGADQVVLDAARQIADGRRDGGSFQVSASTDDDALQNAYWQVANHKAPATRVPNLTLDLLAQPTAAKVASCLAATISTKVQVTGLPTQAPTSTFTGFIEGASESIGVQSWSIGFFTSPVVLEDSTLILNDATFGALDTYLLAL